MCQMTIDFSDIKAKARQIIHLTDDLVAAVREQEDKQKDTRPTVQAKIGGVYKTRSGKTANCVENGCVEGTLICVVNGLQYAYSADGRSFRGFTEFDLVEVLSEPDNRPAITPKVGFAAILRDGRVTGAVTDKMPEGHRAKRGDRYAERDPFWAFIDGCLYSWRAEGNFNETGEHHGFDIVAIGEDLRPCVAPVEGATGLLRGGWEVEIKKGCSLGLCCDFYDNGVPNHRIFRADGSNIWSDPQFDLVAIFEPPKPATVPWKLGQVFETENGSRVFGIKQFYD
jgi:hypothetical protein